MKVTPLAQGTGVPAQSEGSIGRTDSGKLARAKAIASGQDVPRETTGDAQVDRIQSTRTIKMKTQVSTNRDDASQDALQEEVPKIDTVEPTQEVAETKLLDPQLAALARHKRALQVKERELAQREQALNSQAPAGQEDIIAKLKANPLGVLQDAGVTYDQLTEAILANQAGVTPEILQLQKDIKSLKEELTGQLSTRDEQAEQQVLAEIKREASDLIKTGDFEVIREAKANNHPEFTNGRDPVSDLIHRTWKATGEIMDVTEAATLVENQLIDEALPFAKIKKVQSRITPEQEAAQIPAQKPNTKVMRTLTNRDSSSPVMDRRQRAIAAMNGTLKR